MKTKYLDLIVAAIRLCADGKVEDVDDVGVKFVVPVEKVQQLLDILKENDWTSLEHLGLE